jgi:hypothetical protein
MRHETREKLTTIRAEIYALGMEPPVTRNRNSHANRKLARNMELLWEAFSLLQSEVVIRHPLKAWFYQAMAEKYHSVKHFDAEVELLKSYFGKPWIGPPLTYELSLLEVIVHSPR